MKPLKSETVKGMATTYAPTREAWRTWLTKHAETVKSIWLIVYQKKSSTPSVRFHDAIEEAVCFGWVDSQALKRDAESCYLRFSQRNPKSTWGRVSRERAERMIAQGKMTPRGQAVVDEARRSGKWSALAEAQRAVIPPDLQALFEADAAAYRNFQAFPPSARRNILEWIQRAKRPETRRRRVAQTVELAAQNKRANQP